MRLIYICLYIRFTSVKISGYDDISAHKPTKQQGPHIVDGPENALDRSLSTCSSTEPSNPAWWYVDLGKVKSIYDVEIFYRLYSTSYGCARDDAYGELCNETCPSQCQERRCYITNGTCAGCTDGWMGGKCLDVCPIGFYGAECRRTCSKGCKNKTCHHVTGHCEGCRAGWMGYDCNETCGYGAYGENCKRNCSGHCAKQMDCNKESGECDDGCSPGYRGSKCEKECDFGTYGAGCLKLCSGNCLKNKTCNNVNGECIDGCREGFKGTLCDETCKHGTFGPNCSGICSLHCVNRSCNHVTGSCDNGCNPGWRNDKCYEKCRDGTFGLMCKEECSGNCLNNETCYHVDGHCIHGCRTGFQGGKCDGPCDLGYFGEKCLQLCPVNCYDKCNNVNGLCKCKNGWMGRHCTEVCPRERYGEDCKENCSGNCFNNDTCHSINGYCLWGCRDGFPGKRCDRRNELVGFTGTCVEDRSSVGGLTAGLVISFLLDVGFSFITMYLIRKKRTKKEPDQPFYEISDREDFQQGHVENHAYEELNTTQSVHIYRNLSLNDNRTQHN